MTALDDRSGHRGAAAGRHERAGAVPGASFRADIEGLRAVAILLVVAYHAGLPLVSGGFVGVDVFFVISGFLITGLVVREMQTTGTVSVVSFYARRAKRLLPASAVVLVAVAIATIAVVATVDRPQVGLDIMAASVFAANWSFGLSAVDYFAAGIPSPVLHFWSLSVEEQFYLVWPWLLLLLTIPARRSGRSLAGPLLVGLLVVSIPSLWWSVQQTASAPGWAYISSLTRAWELAVGGGLAMLVPFLARMPRAVAALLGWAGLLAIVWSALAYNELTPFPGSAALAPVLGTAALIAAGTRLPDSGASRLMTTRLMVHIGGLSYSWYLWHWPPLVLGAVWLGVDTLPVGLALVAVLGSYGAALLSKRFIEEPFHHSAVLRKRPRRALRLGAVCMAAGLLAGLAVWLPGTLAGLNEAPASAAPGAVAVLGDPDKEGTAAPETSAPPAAPADGFTPALSKIRSDFAPVYRDGCHQDWLGTDVPHCVYGKADGGFTVVLIGDSHAASWFPPLERIAEQRGWRLISLTKNACSIADATLWSTRLERVYQECDAWREAVHRRVAAEKPDLVVTTGRMDYTVVRGSTQLGSSDSASAIGAGLTSALQRLDAEAGTVLVLRDNPMPGVDRVTCLSRNEDDPSACDQKLSEMRSSPFVERDAAEAASVSFADTHRLFCQQGNCPTVIGGVVVWRDDDHATATYTRTLAPYLQRIIDRATQS